MRTILILAGRYLPGYKDGGPVRTIENLTNIFGKQYDIRIMCKDRDHGDLHQYSNILVNTYNKVGNANVYYVKDGKFKCRMILKEIKKVDLIYCCGPYNSYAIKTMVLKKLNLFPQPLVIASMGSFSRGALSIKSKKKTVFLYLMKKFGFFNEIVWSVTSDVEKKELQDIFGKKVQCIIAEDLPRIEKTTHQHKKQKNSLKIIFISRIAKMKNLLGAIEILCEITNYPLEFDIYGYIEDIEYWNECKKILHKLPKNINWEYCGECDSNNVINVMSNYDVFLFPTLGENFGHVISESLIAGCIPVISNQTPWCDLNEFKCGKVIALDDKYSFVNALYEFIHMDQLEFQTYVNAAHCYIQNKNNQSIKNSGYKIIFDNGDVTI